MAKRRDRRWLIAAVSAAILVPLMLTCICLGVGSWWWRLRSPTTFPPETESYAQARQRFQTKLVRKGAAPQTWQPAVPPLGVTVVEYTSGDLRLKAWVDRPAANAAPRPAVIFLHGGFAFGREDWEQAWPFRDRFLVRLDSTARATIDGDTSPKNTSVHHDKSSRTSTSTQGPRTGAAASPSAAGPVRHLDRASDHLRSLCQQPEVASRFVIYLSRRTRDKVEKKAKQPGTLTMEEGVIGRVYRRPGIPALGADLRART
jgi:hypothetical protein